MCRYVFSILLLRLMCLNLAYSSNVLGDASVNTLPGQLLGADSFTNGTNNFDSFPGIEEKVDISELPYMARINIKMYLPGGKFYEKNCTGIFVEYNVRLVTAAHCVVVGNKIVHPYSVIVRFNSNYLDRGGYTMYAQSIQVHPWYAKNGKGVTTFCDVAYIRARTWNGDRDVRGIDSISVAPAPRYFDGNSMRDIENSGKFVTVVGFGFTKKSRKDKSLTRVSIKLLTVSRCRSMASSLNIRVFDFHACVYAKGLDVCQGEGGQVMFSSWSNVGPIAVFGYGRNCGKRDHPAVFSQIKGFDNIDSPSSRAGLQLGSMPEKNLWFDDDWEEMYEMSGEEGDGQIDSGSGGTDVSISGCLPISTRLGLFMLFVEIISLKKIS